MEFQAVVLAAGRGSRMTDLTASVPKALLPIGNMPMMWYPINSLEKAGFEEAIVIVLDSFCTEAQKLLVEICEVKMHLDFVSIPDQDYMGTADSLRFIQDKIKLRLVRINKDNSTSCSVVCSTEWILWTHNKRDILLISCDLITDVNLHNIANVYRTHDATVTMFLCPVPQQQAEIPVPGPKSKKRSERDFFGFDEKGNRVLFMMSEADLADMDDDKVKFRKSLLKKHPNINIRSNLTDCHLYLLKKWIIDFLKDNKQICSIKGELIPYLVKKQFAKMKKKDPPKPDESVMSEKLKTDILSYMPDDKMAEVLAPYTLQDLSTWNDHQGDMDECYHGNKIRCYAYTSKGGLCVRTNTIALYCETNRQIPKYLMSIKKEMPNIHGSVTQKGKPQIISDSLVGEGATLGEKTSIKRSTIGRCCTIADKVKITNSIILDHVHVAEGSSIQGSVVSANAHISEKCELKDCIVGSGQSIAANSKFTNEAIVEVESMIEI